MKIALWFNGKRRLLAGMAIFALGVVVAVLVMKFVVDKQLTAAEQVSVDNKKAEAELQEARRKVEEAEKCLREAEAEKAKAQAKVIATKVKTLEERGREILEKVKDKVGAERDRLVDALCGTDGELLAWVRKQFTPPVDANAKIVPGSIPNPDSADTSVFDK